MLFLAMRDDNSGSCCRIVTEEEKTVIKQKETTLGSGSCEGTGKGSGAC